MRAVGFLLIRNGWEPLLKAPPNNDSTSMKPAIHVTIQGTFRS